MFKKTVLLLVAATFALAACSPAVAPDVMEDKMEETGHTDDTMMDENKDDGMKDDKSGEAMSDKKDDSMTDGMTEPPAWFAETFTDARTGASFTVNDFKGKVVLVETLAMWCSNCKRQQGEVLKLHEMLGERDDFVSFGLDIDTNENLADLKAYVEANRFDWTYSVASEEVAREIGNLYGVQFLNPPSTPMLVIDRKGEVHVLPFGIKSAQELFDALQPFLAEGM